jgi:hypothetical protein
MTELHQRPTTARSDEPLPSFSDVTPPILTGLVAARTRLPNRHQGRTHGADLPGLGVKGGGSAGGAVDPLARRDPDIGGDGKEARAGRCDLDELRMLARDAAGVADAVRAQPT